MKPTQIMGISERKERDKQEMRERIVEAAAQVFIEEGYERTSIRNIADRIEYSPATIYLYFKDKDELFFAIHELGFQLLLQEMSKVQLISDPLERLRVIAQTYVRFAFEHPEYYNLMFILLAPMNALDEMKPWNNGHQAFAFLQSVIEDCMENGLIPTNDPKAMTFSSWAFVHGMVSLYNRCRMQILEQSEEENRAMIYMAVDKWIEMIKRSL